MPWLLSLLLQKWVHAVRMWLAANCEPLLGADSQLAAALNAFKPTHVIGDSAFVCFRCACGWLAALCAHTQHGR
jgi:hypothetical protein